MLGPRGPFPKTLSNVCVLAAETAVPQDLMGQGPCRLASLPAPAALGTLALLQPAPCLRPSHLPGRVTVPSQPVAAAL